MPRRAPIVSRRGAVRGAVTAALVVGGVALAGGFADVPRADLPVYRVGSTYDNGLYRVTVRSIRVVDQDPLAGYDLVHPTVAVEADLLLRGDRSSRGALNWLLPLDLRLTAAEGQLRTVRDAAAGPPVQPGVPARVLYTWPVPDGLETSADRVRIGVFERYEAEDVPLEGVLTTPVLVGVFRNGS